MCMYVYMGGMGGVVPIFGRKLGAPTRLLKGLRWARLDWARLGGFFCSGYPFPYVCV